MTIPIFTKGWQIKKILKKIAFGKSFYDPETFIAPSFKSTGGEFILGTAAREFVIRLANLKPFFPSTKLRPATLSTKESHSWEQQWCQSTRRRVNLLTGSFIFQRTAVIVLLVWKWFVYIHICLLLPRSNASSEEINKLLKTCDNAIGGMAIGPIHFETEFDPNFLKRRILLYGLREIAHNELTKLQNDGIINAVKSSLWATPIVTCLKKDGVTPRICGDYQMTVN